MTKPLAYLSGHFLPQDEARLPLNDAGFVWGATVTDLCRTFRHQLFRWTDHVTRFRTSCERARVPLLLDDKELLDIAERLLTHNTAYIKDEADLALVMFATPGPIGHYLGSNEQGPPTFGMHTFPIPFERYRPLFERGAKLVIPPTRHVPATSVDPRIKQRSRLYWWIAEQEAHDLDPDANALLLDDNGFVTETAAANLLLVKEGRVMTPWRGRVLGGISLRVTAEICRELGVPFDESDLTFQDCREADEAMLTNTAYCLAPVRSIHDREYLCPGPMFERLRAAWKRHVGIDYQAQIVGHFG